MTDRTPPDAAGNRPDRAGRQARLRAALRANLGRRKGQARDLGAGAERAAEEGETP